MKTAGIIILLIGLVLTIFTAFTFFLPEKKSLISEKSKFPVPGLITVSAMLPSTWQKKQVDMNVTTLKTKDIQWADYVLPMRNLYPSPSD